ncbi:elongation factor P hydroxylase [Pseudoalteromonas xiamenensis]|uniref:Elongation factor P hydroxylase n=1 Tax=Pseudoalteromonas xiamenensis TaxID=882626 RepID=A0A975DI89_9GAMM|nr:elongation factor P hydroxylase [Pseudoalteromonas xiamenensis]QTH72049.1 elongation factor P hydroxylase [Pseudoalteromonas xiamenensis]
MHHIDDLISLFDHVFYASHNTRLVRGEDEPIYLPADGEVSYCRIIFAHGFYASAMHEIAHWLVAGKERRKLVDFGYWYCPDGRDEQQQSEFEKVEVLPQAIEWALSVSAGFPFNVSADNLNGAPTCRFQFQEKVHTKLLSLLDTGFNPRAEALMQALSAHYGTSWPLTKAQFEWQFPEEFRDAV